MRPERGRGWVKSPLRTGGVGPTVCLSPSWELCFISNLAKRSLGHPTQSSRSLASAANSQGPCASHAASSPQPPSQKINRMGDAHWRDGEPGPHKANLLRSGDQGGEPQIPDRLQVLTQLPLWQEESKLALGFGGGLSNQRPVPLCFQNGRFQRPLSLQVQGQGKRSQREDRR